MLKTRRAATFYLAFVAGALVPFVFFLDATFGEITTVNKKDAFNAILREGFTIISLAICPFFIMLASTMLAQIEFRNNTWKQVFASPQPLLNIFLARFMNVHFMILLFMLLFNILSC